MRINKFVAQATGLSRRAADQAVAAGQVTINGQTAELGDDIDPDAPEVVIRLDDRMIELSGKTLTIMLNKPEGYVCSRNGQGSPTVYELLPDEYRELKPVGRLDKDSSGLLLLTNNGHLAHELTHPRYAKEKVYEVTLDKPLETEDAAKLEQGIAVEDYVSRLRLSPYRNRTWIITISQGRNRQIRRTFEALGYSVIRLHRTDIGPFALSDLPSGQFAHTPETA